tara:strand:+ start:54515 stop:58234 length:3720 start_codon:yes stop_codon:yes gene_type:complete
MPIKNTKAFSLESNTGGSPDPIRQSINSYWIYDGSRLIYNTNNTYDPADSQAQTTLLNFEIDVTNPTVWKGAHFALDKDTMLKILKANERLSITPRYLSGDISLPSVTSARTKVDPEKQFDAYIENSIMPFLGTVVQDYKFDLEAPVEYISDVDNSSIIAGTVNFVYNYGLEIYENELLRIATESELANFYNFTPVLPDFSSSSTSLSGESAKKERVPVTKQLVSKDLVSSPAAANQIQDFFMNSEGFLQALSIQEEKSSFPFYNEVYFTNPPDKLADDKFREALKESGLLIAFCDLMNKEDYKVSQGESSSIVEEFAFANSYLSSSYEDNTQTSFREQPALKTSFVKIYDIPEMLKIMYDVRPVKISMDMGPAASRDKVNTRSLRAKGFLTDGEQADYRSDTISKIKAGSNISINYENALDDLVITINELMGFPPSPPSPPESSETRYTAIELDTASKAIESPETRLTAPDDFGTSKGSSSSVKFKPKKSADKSSSETRYTVIDLDTASKLPESSETRYTAIDLDTASKSGSGSGSRSGSGVSFETTGDMEIKETTNYRIYKNVLEGAKRLYSSNVLFYRIKKFEEGSDIPIQNFWIPAEKGYRGMNYIDTQVKYGKMYRYEINAFKFVIGTEYEFMEDETGVLEFSEDLESYRRDISDTITDLEILSGFRKSAEEQLPSLPLSSALVQDLTYSKMLKYLIENDIDIGVLNKSLQDDASKIALFADSILTTGISQYQGVSVDFNTLTDKEKIALKSIQSTWVCLTNNWTEENGPEERGTLLELEKSIKKAKIISLVKNIIDSASKLTSSGLYVVEESAVVIEDLADFQLDKIRDDIEDLSNNTAAPGFSWRENLSPDASTAGEYGFAYYSYLDKEIAETFGFEKEEINSILPITTKESKEIHSEEGRYYREKRELENFYYDYFKKVMSATETIINEYLACYDSFFKAASSIDIVADYKRINKYRLIVQTKPTIKFAELPYYKSEGMILDNPPIYPNVNVVTRRGVADRLSFFMNSGQGQIEVDPVTFSIPEEDFIRNFRRSNKMNDFQPILYRSDETENLGTVFEIRRTSIPPENYESFREARVIRTSTSIKSGKNLPAATYDDEINSNTKYYYIFRVADRRGTISYPSDIMEIEIIENSGIIYPVIKPYELAGQKTDTTKNLKRLLNVVPRITQVFPPADTDSYGSLSAGPTTILGREEESLFGKQFKLRLTSKKTGKVVDLNLNFNATVVERAEAE